VRSISIPDRYYSTSRKDDDIAVLVLKHDVTFSDTIQPVCLADHVTSHTSQQSGVVSSLHQYSNLCFSNTQ
jgi:hypothetical protein